MKMKSLTPWFHVFVIAPLLAYVGWNKGHVNKYIFNVMFIIGLSAIILHLGQLLKSGLSKWGKRQLINIFHIIVVGYLLACTGWRGTKTPSYVFTLMLAAVPFVLYRHGKKLL
jgi:uncharacterized membrane protein